MNLLVILAAKEGQNCMTQFPALTYLPFGLDQSETNLTYKDTLIPQSEGGLVNYN